MNIKKLIMVLVLTGTLGGWVFYELYPFDGTYHVRTLKLPKDRRLEVRAEVEADVAPALSYRIPGTAHSGIMMICTKLTSELSFQVISAEQGDLIGIVETSLPSALLVLHDFRQDISWSHTGPKPEERPARGQALLERLRVEHPNVNWVLHRE